MSGSDQPSNSSATQYLIREIRQDDDTQQFCCVDNDFLPLKDFLSNHAYALHNLNVSKTYVVAIGRRVIAYISLCCSLVRFDSAPKELPQLPFKVYPAIKIGQLAVDDNFKKQGFGTLLINLAKSSAKEHIQDYVGCRLLAVDAHRKAVSYYTHKGFTLLDSPKNLEKEFPVLFLDIGKL